jgi:glyoxylase-like metal-dependent hydrolase (beta-lactamase superfamily II)
MQPLQLFDPESCTYTYVVFDDATREALIIDPVDTQLERDMAVLREHGLRLVWTVETHAHADHITSAGQLAELAGARTAAPAGCGIATASQQLHDGDTLAFHHNDPADSSETLYAKVGVFDTAAIVDGKIYDLEAHLDRFIRSAQTSRLTQTETSLGKSTSTSSATSP